MRKVRIAVLVCCFVLLWQTVALGAGLGSRPLQLGDRGTDVQELQERLSVMGHDPGPADGIFGPQTLAAIQNFQSKRGLVGTGTVDNGTLAALQFFAYTVQAGDTLTILGERFEISPSVIAGINQVSDPDLLLVGQELLVPFGVVRRLPAQSPVSRGSVRRTPSQQGELVSWAEVNGLVSRGSTITITDVVTGRSLQVSRRGGSAHMDVEPLTALDTQTLRDIYGGTWSWDRRAVLVEIGNRIIAGSINGMPHGGADITGNNFPGHFCLHFLGSSTHGTGRIDPAHQAAVRQAAGK